MQGKYKIFDMRLKGYKLKEAMFNGTLMYVYKPYVLYTIDKSSPNDLLNSGGYLPANYETFATKIFINGEETTDLNIEVGQINKIRIHYEEGLTSMSFKDTKIKTLSYVDTTYFTTMEEMFYGCKWLEKVNANSFITKNVTDMSYMFSGCTSLKSLNVSEWKTSNVKNMASMFYNCSSLTSLDLSNFNTKNVLNMHRMFYRCTVLRYLDISNFSTGKLAYTWSGEEMFKDVPELEWNYSEGKYERFFLSESETTYDYEFPWLENCILYSIDPYNMDVNIGKDYFDKVNTYFSEYDTYPYLPYEYGNADNDIESIKVLTKGSYLGSDLENIQVCDVHTIKIKYNPQVKSIKFKGTNGRCPHTIYNLTRLRNFQLTDMEMMFAYSRLAYVTSDITNWDTSEVTNMHGMFSACYSLTSLDVSNWDTSNVTDMRSMFSNCSSLKSLNVTNWNTSEVTRMDYMFNDCDILKEIKGIGTWDTGKVTNMENMFYDCIALTSLNFSNWNTSEVTNMREMFAYCTKLDLLDLSKWNTQKVKYYYRMLYIGAAEVIIDDDIWNPEMTKSAISFSGTFTII